MLHNMTIRYTMFQLLNKERESVIILFRSNTLWKNKINQVNCNYSRVCSSLLLIISCIGTLYIVCVHQTPKLLYASWNKESMSTGNNLCWSSSLFYPLLQQEKSQQNPSVHSSKNHLFSWLSLYPTLVQLTCYTYLSHHAIINKGAMCKCCIQPNKKII